LPAVELHHENWDGSGYPLGLHGAATPLAARIIHIADAYDAMTTDRPYRSGMSHDQAIDILKRNAGTQFDAELVPVFVKLANTAQKPKAKDTSQEVLSLAEAIDGNAEPSCPQPTEKEHA
jgi:HD-GYP domain-containing protein (c-di-GMP phosphodiesterase class II)